MVRLTADLILRSPQYFNAVKDREIDLRGNKIAAIENLGATEDQYDSIDLSDNEIIKLEGFPELKRLTTLLVNNNRISRIIPTLGTFLPKLHTLVLTNNRLVNLADLDPLAGFAKLQTLSLLDNVVTKQPNYRIYVIQLLPKLRLLDFSKVKAKEREAAKAFTASKEDTAKTSVKTFIPGEVTGAAATATATATAAAAEQPVARARLDPPTRLAIQAAIENSQTLAEVAKLEKALQSGQVPADIILPNSHPEAMEEI